MKGPNGQSNLRLGLSHPFDCDHVMLHIVVSPYELDFIAIITKNKERETEGKRYASWLNHSVTEIWLSLFFSLWGFMNLVWKLKENMRLLIF